MSPKNAPQTVLSHSIAASTSIVKHNTPTPYKATRLTSLAPRAFKVANDPLAPTAPLVFPENALAPLPPSGVPDYLLLASVKDSDLTLTFPVPDSIEDPDQDTVQLFINNIAIGTPAKFDGAQPGAPFDITLAATDRTQGTHQLFYRVFYYWGGSYDDSPNQSFRVDTVAPGRPFLGLLKVDEDIVNNGLTPDKLKADGATQYLESFVPSYEGVEPGDTIEGFVNNTQAVNSSTIVGDGDLNDYVELRFTRNDIERADDGSVVFEYQVRDRAGNLSDKSRPLPLRVLLKGQIDDLEAPEMPANDDGIINEADARGPVDVIIPGHTALQPGDAVMVEWGDIKLTAVSIPPGEEGNDPLMTVKAPYAALYDTWKKATNGANAVADIDVRYYIMRNGLSAGRSPATPIRINLFQAGGDPDPVLPEHPNLKAAQLRSAGGSQNEIPVEDYSQNATITVAWYDRQATPGEVFLLNDRLNVKYANTALAERIISAGDVSNKVDLVFTLTAAQIGAEGSGTNVLQYTITRAVTGGTENTSLSPPQDVIVKGSDELPGEGILPIGSYTPINDRGAIGPAEARQGVKFVTPHYINKAVGDTITLDIVQTAGVPHNPGEAPIEATRIQLTKIVGPDDQATSTEFVLPSATLMQPIRLCHADAIWSAENVHGKVENQDTYVVIDSRGWTP